LRPKTTFQSLFVVTLASLIFFSFSTGILCSFKVRPIKGITLDYIFLDVEGGIAEELYEQSSIKLPPSVTGKDLVGLPQYFKRLSGMIQVYADSNYNMGYIPYQFHQVNTRYRHVSSRRARLSMEQYGVTVPTPAPPRPRPGPAPAPLGTKTRLKRLPVIGREHFRKTRTIFFYKHLLGMELWNL
jgi:hypothetical protein